MNGVLSPGPWPWASSGGRWMVKPFTFGADGVEAGFGATGVRADLAPDESHAHRKTPIDS
jgi:hypothetical protein